MPNHYLPKNYSAIRDFFLTLSIIAIIGLLVGGYFYIEYKTDNTSDAEQITLLNSNYQTLEESFNRLSSNQIKNSDITSLQIQLNNINQKIRNLDFNEEQIEDYVDDYTEDEWDNIIEDINDLFDDLDELEDKVNENSNDIDLLNQTAA